MQLALPDQLARKETKETREIRVTEGFKDLQGRLDPPALKAQMERMERMVVTERRDQ